MKMLAQRDPKFLDTVAPLVEGNSRNHIARSRDQVYPLKPELSEYTIEFVPGWWLGTNIANREKIRIIKKACEAAGLANQYQHSSSPITSLDVAAAALFVLTIKAFLFCDI
jgi:hypothetical protein